MIYAIFTCTLYTNMPQLNSCRMPYPNQAIVYQSRDQCEKEAARATAAVSPPVAGQTLRIKYVCMEKQPTWQPAR
jgi:hypothetical protein